jgi:hypothetical protein
VVSKEAGPIPELDGAELPFPSGVSPQRWADDAVANMKPNDGDQKAVPDAPFANGKDQRNKTGGPNTPDSTGRGL